MWRPSRQATQPPQRQFIANRLFLPTSDQKLLEDVLAVLSHVAASAMRGNHAYDGPAVAAQRKMPTLHLAATSALNPLYLMSQWLPTIVNG
jgi:hypothetical protein